MEIYGLSLGLYEFNKVVKLQEALDVDSKTTPHFFAILTLMGKKMKVLLRPQYRSNNTPLVLDEIKPFFGLARNKTFAIELDHGITKIDRGINWRMSNVRLRGIKCKYIVTSMKKFCATPVDLKIANDKLCEVVAFRSLFHLTLTSSDVVRLGRDYISLNEAVPLPLGIHRKRDTVSLEMQYYSDRYEILAKMMRVDGSNFREVVFSLKKRMEELLDDRDINFAEIVSSRLTSGFEDIFA